MEADRRIVTLSPGSLIPTNVNGVVAFPALPHDLDVKSADDSVLAKYGIFLPRPGRGKDPGLTAMWNKIAGQKWRSIVPQLGPLQRRRPVFAPNIPRPRHTPSSQPGYAVCSLSGPPVPPWEKPFDNVFATWIVPNLEAPPQGLPQGNTARLAWWVALDNAEPDPGEMLQAGFSESLPSSTNVTSVGSPWWFWFPPNDVGVIGQTLLNFPRINVGDEVMFSASYVFTTASPVRPLRLPTLLYGVMSVYNVTQSFSMSVLFPPPAGAKGPGRAIEWVLENYNWSNAYTLGGAPVVPGFDAVTFSDVGEGNPANGAVTINMQDTSLPGDPVVVDVSSGPDSVTMSYV